MAQKKDIQTLFTEFHFGRLSRRQFVAASAGLVGLTATEALLSGCSTPSPPAGATAPPAAAAKAPAAPAATAPVAAANASAAQKPAGWVRPEDWTQMQWFDCTKFRKAPPWKLANLSQGPTNSWALMLDGHTEYAVQEKYKGLFSDYFYADGQGNESKQVSDIESLLVKKPDVIIATPLGAALKAGLEKAFDSGIPVIQMQMPYQSDKFVTYDNANNYVDGAHCAEWIAKKLNGKGKIVMSSGIAGTDTAETRLKGAKDVFSKYPGIQVLAQGYTDWSISKAKQGFEAWLASFPQIDAIWSDSSFGAWGAIEAFAEAKRDIPPVTGEPLNGFLKLCKQYNVDFFAYGYPSAIGLDMVDLAVRAMMGEVVPKYVFESSLEFDKSELDRYLHPDASDDLWVDYRFPSQWIDKLFKK